MTTATGPKSGKFGVINGHNAVYNWALEDTMQPESYYASNTMFGAFRNAGVVDWSGTFEQFTGFPTLFPGDTFTFTGYTAPITGVYGTNGPQYTGTGIVDSIAITWNWQPTQSLTTVTSFSGAGALSDSDAYSNDTTYTSPQKMCNNLIPEYSANGSAWTEWPNVTQAVWTCTAANQSYVNSSTDCATVRVGGNIDWTLAVTEQEASQILTQGTSYYLRLYTTSTLFWLLHWGMLQDYSGLTVNRQTGDIITKTANLVMNGGLAGALGTITNPSTTEKWPLTVV